MTPRTYGPDRMTLFDLQRLHARSSQGKWRMGNLDGAEQRTICDEHIELATFWHHSVGSLEKEMEANAEFVVAMHNALPDILAALESADEMAAQLTEFVEATEQDMKHNRGWWSLRTVNCFAPARKAVAAYRGLAALERLEKDDT